LFAVCALAKKKMFEILEKTRFGLCEAQFALETGTKKLFHFRLDLDFYCFALYTNKNYID